MLFKDYTSSIIASLVMLAEGAVMAAIAMKLTGEPFTGAAYFTNCARAFTINYLASLIIPASEWGGALCGKLKLTPGSIRFVMVCNIIVTAVYVMIVTAGMVLIVVGLSPMFWSAFTHLLPVLALAGYVVADVVSVIGARFASWIQSK